jgi:hypothetical protein
MCRKLRIITGPFVVGTMRAQRPSLQRRPTTNRETISRSLKQKALGLRVIRATGIIKYIPTLNTNNNRSTMTHVYHHFLL